MGGGEGNPNGEINWIVDEQLLQTNESGQSPVAGVRALENTLQVKHPAMPITVMKINNAVAYKKTQKSIILTLKSLHFKE